MRMRACTTLLVLFALGPPRAASALPRFAARNQMECIQCHINPTGGGMRNDYGANVFEKTWLPLAWTADSWIDPDPPEEGAAAGDGDEGDGWLSFSGRIFDWLSIGGDFRTAYIWVRPDHGVTADADPEVTSSFFLMQADLYHAARLGPHVTFVLDVGVYSGFEAWGLFRPFLGIEGFDLYLKAGRFLPPFGIREVEHQLFTREGVGLSGVDRDTGVEATAYVGPLTLSLALTNGTFGDTAFDTAGSERRTFEKAITARASGRLIVGPLRAQLGASFSYNDNLSQPNPLFSSELPPPLAAGTGRGVNEVRAGPFLTASLGRFTYLGDVVIVHDAFRDDAIPNLTGYATYQELSFIPLQGLELVMTYEFMDPNTRLGHNVGQRLGAVVELFPLPFTELRLMMRRRFGDRASSTDATDLVFFLHLFL